MFTQRNSVTTLVKVVAISVFVEVISYLKLLYQFFSEIVRMKYKYLRSLDALNKMDCVRSVTLDGKMDLYEKVVAS